jgi:hypothetical protein
LYIKSVGKEKHKRMQMEEKEINSGEERGADIWN